MTVKLLLEKGHDVKDIRGSELEGISDKDVWGLAQNESRMLITTDKGFMQYRNNLHKGILIVRLKKPNRIKIHNSTMKAITQFPKNEEWNGLIVVMRDNIQSISRLQKKNK